MIPIPKLSYLKSQLVPHKSLDPGLYSIVTHLNKLYQLGEIQGCRRALRGKSLNVFVTTTQGKFVFSQHRLLETDVAYEYQVLDYLQQQDFPAPYMLTNQDGQAWVAIEDRLYSIYNFEYGYCPADFIWWPSSTQRAMINQCGRILAMYHQVVAPLTPSAYKWSGYQPATYKRWREGEWFRQALVDIRSLLQKPAYVSPLDDFVRTHIGAFDKMLSLEPEIEDNIDLTKCVIHGDYSLWNVLFRREGKSPVVLDFNEARLDLRIYDIILATFWFAWRGNHLDQDRAQALQAGYCEVGQFNESEKRLAGSVFQWIMTRSIVERLQKYYLGSQAVFNGPAGLERQYQMCLFAQQYPHQLVAGLNRIPK